MSDEKKENDKILEHIAMEGASAEIADRYGKAASEHFAAFSGKSVGKELSRGLKSISQTKVNNEYREINKKQQAGFSAEVKSVARNNADNIIKGKKERYIRTDDMGSVNDPIYDIKILDNNGKEISGSGSQMKFVGNTPKELLNKLKSKEYRKYLEADVKLAIPDNYYDDLMGNNIIDKEIDKLKEKLECAEKDGNVKIASENKAQIEYYKKIKKNLRKSGLTRKESMEARNHPLISTAKDVGKLGHKAGIKQAKTGVVISGSISIVKNVVACMKGEKAINDAALDVAKETGAGVAFSYVTAFSGTVVNGVMKNSSHVYVQSLSKTNLAVGLVSTTANIGKTMMRYINGELTGAQCVETLGKQGVGEIGSAMYSAIALAAVKGSGSVAIKVLAGMAGSTLGYAAAVAIYQQLATSLKEKDLAVENRTRIEAECEEAILLICQYRKEMNTIVEQYLSEHLEVFDESFATMDKAIIENDVNGFIAGNTMIQEKLGHQIQFRSQVEFDDIMSSDTPLKL